jgi:aminoglycoside phosphotransferase (APT) family kinase protein
VLAKADPGGPTTFIHRDYHHGNTLWRGERLTGIVDWTTGCLGPPGIDVAHERLNLVWDYGIEAADAFLLAAGAAGVSAHHPVMDLLVAADWISDDPPANLDEAERFDRYEDFVLRALAELGG